jgi:hypothetical protein
VADPGEPGGHPGPEEIGAQGLPRNCNRGRNPQEATVPDSSRDGKARAVGGSGSQETDLSALLFHHFAGRR